MDEQIIESLARICYDAEHAGDVRSYLTWDQLSRNLPMIANARRAGAAAVWEHFKEIYSNQADMIEQADRLLVAAERQLTRLEKSLAEATRMMDNGR